MAHHAYFVVGEAEDAITKAHAFAVRERGIGKEGGHTPDILVLRYGLLSVDDARALRALADLSPVGNAGKALIISAGRLFHEAQNALLKLFEEPAEGTTLILVIPSEGILLPTLRSRLLALPHDEDRSTFSADVRTYIEASHGEREKMVEKILNRTKSDNDDEKQAGRLAAIHLAEGLAITAHEAWRRTSDGSTRDPLREFLDDLDQFLPILHERSAPLKLIFEHIRITTPGLATKA